MVKAGGNVPVNAPYIVAILIFPYFTEGYSPSFESAMIFACKNVPAQPPGLYFNSPDFF
jgi:hypothetical protein